MSLTFSDDVLVFLQASDAYITSSRNWLIQLFKSVGGHTAEMLALVSQMDTNYYQPRCYVVAATDAMSAQKAVAYEQSLLQKQGNQVQRLHSVTAAAATQCYSRFIALSSYKSTAV